MTKLDKSRNKHKEILASHGTNESRLEKTQEPE